MYDSKANRIHTLAIFDVRFVSTAVATVPIAAAIVVVVYGCVIHASAVV